MPVPCVVCEHCQAPFHRHENRLDLNGCSYHKKCGKCYVCSDTNLHDAEVFKGVIFCFSCSQRIFQGCTTARKTKEGGRRPGDRYRNRRSHRTREGRSTPQNGILAMAAQTVLTDTSKSSCDQSSKNSEPFPISTELALTVTTPRYGEVKEIKKNSTEMGMTTEVTQQLLKQLNCPVIHGYDYRSITKRARPAPVFTPLNKKSPCSDLRIAELGTSREIANMALRHKSELPVIITSGSPTRVMTSRSGTISRDSDSGDRNDWMECSCYTSENSTKSNWLDRRMGSLLMIPFYAFKRNILDKKSGLSVSNVNKASLRERLKLPCNEIVLTHQRHGLKRLYSTINRKKVPQKLGWLSLVANVNDNPSYNLSKLSTRSCHNRNGPCVNKYSSSSKRCKHFHTSHSYRCMRAQAMRLAGPTKSELAIIRARVKKALLPPGLRNINFNVGRFKAITTSNGCGSTNLESLKIY